MLQLTSLVITLQPHCDTWLIYCLLFSLSFPSQAQSARLPHFGGVDVHFSGMIDCFIQVVRNKGILSLWTGLTANIIKASFTHVSVIFFHSSSSHILYRARVLIYVIMWSMQLIRIEISARVYEHDRLYDVEMIAAFTKG